MPTLTQILNNIEQLESPCGCGLRSGQRVEVVGCGEGKIERREGRQLRVKLDSGKTVIKDQRYVHRAD